MRRRIRRGGEREGGGEGSGEKVGYDNKSGEEGDEKEMIKRSRR